ncbi:hypothetical protein GCM10011322_01800 [Salinarimonas ramus]|uniref:Uncharacterized protein n=1 Tax=Salinarimonas ramus TaxID=690164 RepID=A0A917V213_9HYPH|nr:hypothetical protein GCM10011322_01800 [Salinarimonas ramus]
MLTVGREGRGSPIVTAIVPDMQRAAYLWIFRLELSYQLPNCDAWPKMTDKVYVWSRRPVVSAPLRVALVEIYQVPLIEADKQMTPQDSAFLKGGRYLCGSFIRSSTQHGTYAGTA